MSSNTFCFKCNTNFQSITHLKRHESRKNPCNAFEEIKNENTFDIDKFNKLIASNKKKIAHYNKQTITTTEGITCGFCNKLYISKITYTNHNKNNCKVKKELEKQINILNDKKKAIKELKREITEKIIQKSIVKINNNPSNVTNNINNTTINGNVNNTYVMINYNKLGEEDLSHITESNYLDYHKTHYNGIKKLINQIYLSNEKPENHILKLKSAKSKSIFVKEDNAWTEKDRKEIISDIVVEKILLLKQKAREISKKIGYKYNSDDESDDISVDIENNNLTEKEIKYIQKCIDAHKQFLKTYDERTELAEKTTIEDISENIATYTKNNKHLFK
jgi:hypothetical protein